MPKNKSNKRSFLSLLIYLCIKLPFYWLTTYFSLLAYRYANFKFVNFPVTKVELKANIQNFICDNKLIPDGAVIESIEYQDTDETDKDNLFIKIYYLFENKPLQKHLFIKFFFKKDRKFSLTAFDNAIRIGRCRELYFYENLAGLIPVRIPRFLAGKFNSFSSFGYIVIERIENPTLFHDYEDIPFEVTLSCLQKMAAIHATFFNYNFTPFNHYFIERENSDLFKWILFFKNVNKQENFVIIYNKLCDYIDRFDSTLIHNDFRVGNMIFISEDHQIKEIIVSDWFYPCVSTALYDFCYFIVLGLPTEIRRQNTERLIDTYLDALKQYGYSYPKEKFMHDYQVVLTLIVFYAAGCMMNDYFQGSGTDTRDDIIWRERLLALYSEIDFAQVAELIQVENLTLKTTIENLKQFFSTELFLKKKKSLSSKTDIH